jgi:peptide-methionine (S)-S-oxide reductase
MDSLEKATFAAGCFWGVEEYFRNLPGVTGTAVGYIGGDKPNPTYKDVCYTETGHAEAVEITYDPTQISFETLLGAFFELHDPTQLNRQGPDIGDQYRSAVFYHSDSQRAASEALIQRLTEAKAFPRPIVTQVVPATEFWRAEEYHQQYLAKRGLASCHI